MKKLTTIFLLTLLSALVSNAQKITDTMGDVCIPYPIIKTIQTDLLIGDSAKALLTIASTESSLLKRQVFDQMNSIDLYKASDNNLKAQIGNLKDQLGIHINMYNTAEKNFNTISKQFRNNKIKNTFWDIILIVGIGVLAGEALHYRSLYIKTM